MLCEGGFRLEELDVKNQKVSIDMAKVFERYVKGMSKNVKICQKMSNYVN